MARRKGKAAKPKKIQQTNECSSVDESKDTQNSNSPSDNASAETSKSGLGERTLSNKKNGKPSLSRISSSLQDDNGLPTLKSKQSSIDTLPDSIENASPMKRKGTTMSKQAGQHSNKEVSNTSLKHKGSKEAGRPTDNQYERGLKRRRTGSIEPCTSTASETLALKNQPGSTQRPETVSSMKRSDTLIITPSTSGITEAPHQTATKIKTQSTMPVPSTSGQGAPQMATPMELIRIATLKKNLSREEIVNILPRAASLSDRALSTITEPTVSDPEARALIAKSMELMRRASLRQCGRRHSTDEDEPEVPVKKLKVTDQQLTKNDSYSKRNTTDTATSKVCSEQSVKSLKGVKEMSKTQSSIGMQHHDSDSNGVVVGRGDEQFDEDVDTICEVHPDCDPVYIREQLLLVVDDPQRVSTVTFDLFSATDVPTRADREVIRERERKREELANSTFDTETFLKRFPDPQLTFEEDMTVFKTKLYADHARTFLKNKFPAMNATYMSKVLRDNNNYLTPTYLQLKTQYDAWLSSGKKTRNRKRFLITDRTKECEYPLDPDEEFYWELHYINKRQEILDDVIPEKKSKFEKAKRDGKLRMCDICYNEDIFECDMLPCLAGHSFCKECVKMSAQEQIKQGKARISCLENDCNERFQLYAMEKLLQQHQSAILLKRLQEEELRLAEIDGLVTCPFCPYAVVIPNNYPTRVLHCEGPDCMLSSCRNCKEVAHVPMSCEEFQEQKQKMFKTFVENALADAMIRECSNCHLRFYKEEGCNFMTCSSCGTKMCYVCRKTIDGYGHFRYNDTCQQYINIDMFHRAEVLEAYNNLERNFQEAHPDMGSLDIPDIYRPEGL